MIPAAEPPECVELVGGPFDGACLPDKLEDWVCLINSNGYHEYEREAFGSSKFIYVQYR